ncbi:MAG: insulinase family protein, partial [Armatimonadota bacterium]|nr:insulinase family protein [Armatimonadota bacterium]
MMFKGTSQLRPGDIDRLFSERGGVNNAETTQDYTAYNETLPSSALQVALRVEADRMERSAMAPAELAHEKTVVLSELEGDENSPLYKLDEAVTGAAFAVHPYRNPVGGYLTDVRNFTPAEVGHYYRGHYASNNAILVVVGDFNTTALQKTVAYDFVRDYVRPLTHVAVMPEPPQNAERRVSVSGVGDTAYVEQAYHVPETGQREHYVMDVISTVLGSGRSSRLYRALVEKGLATEVEAGDPDMKDPYLMQITATVATGHSPTEVEGAIEQEIERLKREPVGADELKKTVNQVKANFVYRDDSVTQQASELGAYAAITSYRYMDTYLPQIASVTPAEIQSAAQNYFGASNRTTGWFIPRPPRPGEALPSVGRGGGIHYKVGDAFPALKPWLKKQPARTLLSPRPRPVSPSTTDLSRLIGRRFHRHTHAHRPPPYETGSSNGDSPPSPPAAVLAALVPSPTRSNVAVYRQALANGMVVIVYPNHANPDVAVSGSLRAGSYQDGPGRAGLANFTAAMLDRGTHSRTEDQIASRLDNVGASIDFEAQGSATSFTAHSLTEHFPLTLDILSDELRNPAFSPATFDRVKNELQTAIGEGNDDPATVAVQNLFSTLYPEDYPLHWPTIGTLETVSKLTRSDLDAFHRQYYRPDITTIVVVGDVDPVETVAQVERSSGTWAAVGPT